ncbi:MAG: FolC bifunctional protein [Geobacteraceae bacterium]|nr:FolC bifunctional protein [Geobacteraceae bacterium]
MTYQDIVTYLYGLGRFGMKPGLEKIKSILGNLSDPQDSLRIIHVAGTNGKGSTAAFLSSILTAAGYKAGLFTSPHLISFTERIRINGDEIEENEVVSVAERAMEAAPDGTTFFEMATAMAFLYFAEQGADPVIMETGMGGSLDATNVSSKILSVITPVSLDHCEYLGSSISSIAREKAGIIEPGKPVVVSSQEEEALNVISDVCSKLGSPLYSFGTHFDAFWSTRGLSYSGPEWELDGLRPGIPGRYQAANAATALCAAEMLGRRGFAVNVGSARTGVEKAFWPGRMEMLRTSPRIILDGAHNPAGAAALSGALADIPRDRLILIAGVMSGKDIDGILRSLGPLADHVLAVAPGMPRALSSGELAGRCVTAGYRAVDAGTVAGGLDTALREAGPEDLIVVCGSLFTVGEARAVLLHRKFEPCRG